MRLAPTPHVAFRVEFETGLLLYDVHPVTVHADRHGRLEGRLFTRADKGEFMDLPATLDIADVAHPLESRKVHRRLADMDQDGVVAAFR